MSDTAKSSGSSAPRRRWPRILVLVAGILVLLVVVLYFVATSSAFLQGVILPRVGKSINATVTVGDAAIHPFKEVVLHNLKVQTTGDEPLVVVAELRARYTLTAILGGNLQIQEVSISSPTISMVENPDGSSNLDPILKSQKEKPVAKKPASGSPPAKPPQVDLKKFAMTEATLRRVKLYPGGKRDATEISHLTVTLDDLKNGQTGKLAMSADIKAENNPPPPGTNGLLQASLKGNYDFSLTADLKPGSIKGNTHLTVARAEGAMSDLAALSADLDCEMSPTDIKQVSLHFQKNEARLGEIRVSGPFDASKAEGRLAVQILAIDRQALNLFGAAQGMDFGPTTINSTNLIVMTKAGAVINAVGQLIINKLQITRAGDTTPALNLQAGYNATVDNEQHVMSVRDTTLAARIETDPPLEAKLQLEASVQNQIADIRQILLSLTPTARAKNQLELKGRVDLSKADAVQGNLNLAAEALDLTGYYDFATANPKKPAPKPGAPTGPAPAVAKAEKEPQPAKLPLRDFTFGISLRRVYLREVDIADFQVGTKINAGHVVIAPFKLALNGAPVNSEVDLDLGVAGYKYNFSLGAQAIPLAPLVNSFQPDRKGQVGGTLNAKAYIAGAGVTPASLQKNLTGNFDVGTTNLNLAVANVRNPLLKALLNVIVMIPELARSPEAAVSSLLGSLTEKVGTSGKGGLSEDLAKSPIDAIVVRGAISAGQMNLQNALVQSPAFQALASGSVTLADPITNSAIQIPVAVSLPRALANSMRLVPPNTPADAAYVKLPDFLSMKGTAGQPKADINKIALAGLALQGVGAIPGVGDKANGVLQGLGGLLKGNAAGSTNSPGGTNASPSPVGGLLDGLLKGKTTTATNALGGTKTNQSPAGSLLDGLLKPKNQ